MTLLSMRYGPITQSMESMTLLVYVLGENEWTTILDSVGLVKPPIKKHTGRKKKKGKKRNGCKATLNPTYHIASQKLPLQLSNSCPANPPPLALYPTTTFCTLLISLNDLPPPPIQSAYTCNHALRPSDRSCPSPTGSEISYHCFEFWTWTGFTESRGELENLRSELIF